MLQPKVTAVKPLPDYKLLLDFETGERKIFDVMPYIRGDWYGKLRDVDVFRTVHVAGISIAWADGQDIAPHELYDDSVPTCDPDFTKLPPIGTCRLGGIRARSEGGAHDTDGR